MKETINIAGVELETGQEKIAPYNKHTKEYIDAMKPSERIKEIYDSFEEDEHIGVKHHFAIIQYLDEQYEQNKIKEYEEHNRLIRSVQV